MSDNYWEDFDIPSDEERPQEQDENEPDDNFHQPISLEPSLIEKLEENPAPAVCPEEDFLLSSSSKSETPSSKLLDDSKTKPEDMNYLTGDSIPMSTNCPEEEHVSLSTREKGSDTRNDPPKQELKVVTSKVSLVEDTKKSAAREMGSQTKLGRQTQSDIINVKNGQFEELVKAVKIIDEQKYNLSILSQEVKNLKMENQKREKYLHQLQKSQSDVPQLVHTLTDEIRVLRAERRAHHEKISILEKNSHANIEEIVKLQTTIEKLNGIIKSKKLNDAEKLQEELISMTTQLEENNKKLDEKDWQKKAKYLEGERNMEMRDLRRRCARLQIENQNLIIDNQSLKEKLKERDQQIAVASIYSLSNRKKHSQSQLSENDLKAAVKSQSRRGLRSSGDPSSRSQCKNSKSLGSLPSMKSVQFLRNSNKQEKRPHPKKNLIETTKGLSVHKNSDPKGNDLSSNNNLSKTQETWKPQNTASDSNSSFPSNNSAMNGIPVENEASIQDRKSRLELLKKELKELEGTRIKSLSGLEKRASLKLEIEKLQKLVNCVVPSERIVTMKPVSLNAKDYKLTQIPVLKKSQSLTHHLAKPAENYLDDFDE